MSQPLDENGRLASLLRAIPAPEPPLDFLPNARRRYLEAIEARYRREVFMSLAAAFIGLVLVVTLPLPAVEPPILIAWFAEVAADLTKWMTGVAVVASLVPLAFWTSVVLGFAASALSLALLARSRSPAVVK